MYRAVDFVMDLNSNFIVTIAYGGTYSKYSNVVLVTTDGTQQPLAGSTAAENGIVDGIGSQARFTFPFAIAMDTSGIFYVADSSSNACNKKAISCV